MRDHTKLKVFSLADDLTVRIYKCTQGFPDTERYGLQSQLRRAAVSVPTNIVEGCTRSTPKDFLRFLTIAHGSASEVRYLIDLSGRIELLAPDVARLLHESYDLLVRNLGALIRTIDDDLKRNA